MSSYKLLVKKRVAEHYFESLKNLNVILLKKTYLFLLQKSISESVISSLKISRASVETD